MQPFNMRNALMLLREGEPLVEGVGMQEGINDGRQAQRPERIHHRAGPPRVPRQPSSRVIPPPVGRVLEQTSAGPEKP